MPVHERAWDPPKHDTAHWGPRADSHGSECEHIRRAEDSWESIQALAPGLHSNVATLQRELKALKQIVANQARQMEALLPHQGVAPEVVERELFEAYRRQDEVDLIDFAREHRWPYGLVKAAYEKFASLGWVSTHDDYA